MASREIASSFGRTNLKSCYFNIQVVFGFINVSVDTFTNLAGMMNPESLVGRHPALASSALRGTEQKWAEWCSKWFLGRNGKSNSQGGLP